MKLRMGKLQRSSIVLTITFLSIFLIFSGNANASYFTTWFNDNSTNPSETFAPSFETSLSCTVVLNANMNLTSTTAFTSTVDFFAPFTTQLASAPRSFASGNFTCEDFGESNTTASNSGIFEAKIASTDTADTSRNTFIQTDYICSTPNNLMTFTFQLDNTETETNIYHSSDKEQAVTPTLTLTMGTGRGRLSTSNFGLCLQLEVDLFKDFQDFSSSASARRNDYFYFVFNSSNGELNYTVNFTRDIVDAGGPSATPNVETSIQVYPLNNPAGFVEDQTGCGVCSGTLTLAKNTLFVFIAGSRSDMPSTNVDLINVSNPIQNISIDTFEPQFVCSEFSACINGTQFRTCTDQLGVEPDEIQFQTCFVPQDFDEIILGFEEINTSTIEILECKKDAFFCSASPTTIELEVPNGWTVNFEIVNDSGTLKPHEAMAFITDDEALTGFRSLEVNYRPPKLDVVSSTGGGAAFCDNVSTGFQASVQTIDLNATIVSNNFTFPPVFPALTWAARRADTPREQYDNNFFGANPFCSPITLCYGDCNATILGEYQVVLQELNPFGALVRNVFRFEGDAPVGTWGIITVDLNNTDINTTAPHRILIATDVDDQTSPLPRRMFFDDFKVQALSQPLIADCQTFCNGSDLVSGIEQDGACFVTTTLNESSCVAIVEAAAAAAQAAAEAENFAPTQAIVDILNASGLNESFIGEQGFSFILFFVSPFFIAFAIILIIGVFAEFKIAQASKSSSGGVIFGLIMLSGSLILTLQGTFPLAFGILFIVLGGLLIANKFNQLIRGGN